LLTLNEIHAQIVALANAHYQIAEVGMGTIAELQGKPDRLYPLLWLSNEGGSLEDNYKVDNIRLTMFGRVIVGEEGQDDDASEIEVLSDMQLVLLDFLNYFHQQHGQEYVTDKAATLEHFTERTNDRTAGYSCVLELKQFYDWNKCNIPQSGAVIPPTIDGLTLYDFCDQSVLDRLTAEQNACLLLEFGNCADATVQLNGTTIGTIASGATGDFPVNLDGSPSGVWDGTAWQVTSTPCADATVELNGVEMTTIPSGDTENISIRQSSGATEVGSKQGVHWRIDDSAISINGSPVADVKAEDALDIDVTQDGSPVGSWNGSAWIIPPATGGATLTIGVYSDIGLTIPITSANFEQEVYVNLNVVGITTPTEYRFMIFNAFNNGVLYIEAGTPLAYTVSSFNDLLIYAEATDGTTIACALEAFELTINADVNATGYINKHNSLSGQTMASPQQQLSQWMYSSLKGANTTFGSDLWSKFVNSNGEIYVFMPVSNASVSLPTIAINLVDVDNPIPIVGFVPSDVETNGVTGGAGKYLAMNNAPSDFGQNNISTHIFTRSLFSGFSNHVTMGATTGSINTSGSTMQVSTNTGGASLNNIFVASNFYEIGTNSLVRSAAGEFKFYANGVLKTTLSVASTTPTTNKFYGFGNNSNGTLERAFTGKLVVIANCEAFTANEEADWNEIWQYVALHMDD
jgi:hypothetical protein